MLKKSQITIWPLYKEFSYSSVLQSTHLILLDYLFRLDLLKLCILNLFVCLVFHIYFLMYLFDFYCKTHFVEMDV